MVSKKVVAVFGRLVLVAVIAAAGASSSVRGEAWKCADCSRCDVGGGQYVHCCDPNVKIGSNCNATSENCTESGPMQVCNDINY